MTGHPHPLPVSRRILTPGVILLGVFAVIGMGVAGYRFVFGLQAVTNLDQQHPWGLWIAIDVATGVALAAGGFTTAALAYIFRREDFHVITRPALLTAMLGYTFVGIGLMVDLGRYYNIWHPMLPSMWQGNSVLFEVGLCVMCYLTVLYIEFLPIVCEQLMSLPQHPRLGRLAAWVKRLVNKTMFLFILAGVVLSCLHQSSLGNLMVIAPTKMHPLWFTPILSLLFLLSAIAVGFPMVIVESVYASWSLKLPPESGVLCSLSRYVPPLLGLYLAFKVGDLLIRGSYVHVFEGSIPSVFFTIEMLFGIILPFVLFLLPQVRNSTPALGVAALLVVLGVALNRVNVFLVAYNPPYATKSYFPAMSEWLVTIGLISALILAYRVAVTYLPVICHTPKGALR